MARTFTRLFCLSFSCLACSNAAEDNQAYMSRHCRADGQSCDELFLAEPGEEIHGLEMVQIHTASIHKGSKKGKAHEQDAGEEGSVSDKLLHADISKDPNYHLLGQKDAERMRFIAYHPAWTDVVDMWMDGFFQRYYSGDAGNWNIWQDKLYLKWIGWDEEMLETDDGGRSFKSAKNNFVLKNPNPDRWWLSHFDVNFRTDSERESAVEAQRELALAEANKAAAEAEANRRLWEKSAAEAAERQRAEKAAAKRAAEEKAAAEAADSQERAVALEQETAAQEKSAEKKQAEEAAAAEAEERAAAEAAERKRAEEEAATKAAKKEAEEKAAAEALEQKIAEEEQAAVAKGIGTRAELDEQGFESVVQYKNNAEMEAFMRRTVALLGHQISNEKLFKAAVPLFSGDEAVQTWEALLEEFDDQALTPDLKRRYLTSTSSQ
mmetsp:Transcript_25081/g.45630  ORF Transcript_25081/g.45630 Transcript_25081/m.45630 type:complete len:436 (-) Transcript_25081:87-1394(-)